MSTVINPRRVALLAAIGTSTFALLASAPGANASTLYACVKKNGSARLFNIKPKCRHGEKKLSWNTEGPRGAQGKNAKNGKNGANGANGTNGTNGANGAVAGYSASKELLTTFTGGAEVSMVSKALPAGSYIVFAKTFIQASSTKQQKWGATCELSDGSMLDSSAFLGPLDELHAGAFGAGTTLSLEAAVTLKASTNVSLLCSDKSADESLGIEAGFSQIVAIQTAQNS